MKWNQTKKRIEAMLADSVKQRIRFGTTSYRKTHDETGRGWIIIDGVEILNMPSIDFERETYWRGREQNISYQDAEKELHAENLFSQWDLQRSLFDYLNLPFTEIITSQNPIIRAFGMLDARMGKRRFLKLDVSTEHDLVKRFYMLRRNVEQVGDRDEKELTASLENRWAEKPREGDNNTEKESATMLSKANKNDKLRTLILRLYNREITSNEIVTDIARELFSGFEETENPNLLLRVLLLLEAGSKLLRSSRHVRGVIALTGDAEEWVRPIDDWKPKSHNADRQFSSLARHLWALYDVPLFMDRVWLDGNATQQEWFRHIGKGKNIRTAEGIPIPLTKLMAHHLLLAPDTYSIEGAFRWAQVHALGGDRRIADALLETRICRDFRDNDFWLSVIRFFIRNPMLDPVHFNPIIDYIWNQKYENRVIFIEPGVAEEAGPEQPGFSMKGRTVASLLNAVAIWHRLLGRESKSGNLQWKASGIKPFSYIEGTKINRNMRIWRIRELLSSSELVSEGRTMNHCVASYARSCHAGTCSIWTMDLETEEGNEKLVTIEVGNANRQIRQVRGKRNRLATEKEKDVIKRWVIQEGLELAGWIN